MTTATATLAESERTALGVLADRPSVSGVNDAAAKSLDLLERLCDVTYGKVRERGGITGATPALMDAEPEVSGARLPALSFGGLANPQFGAEKLRPEPLCALGVVGGKLNHGQGSRATASPRSRR